MPTDFDLDLAIKLAKADGLDLTIDHLEILNFLLVYHEKWGIVPTFKVFVLEIKRALGQDKGCTRYMYSLFPENPMRQLCRYANLPEPDRPSTPKS